jgi:hypothetical protein
MVQYFLQGIFYYSQVLFLCLGPPECFFHGTNPSLSLFFEYVIVEPPLLRSFLYFKKSASWCFLKSSLNKLLTSVLL